MSLNTERALKSAKSRHSQSYSSSFDCQKMNSHHTYTLNSLWSIWYCTIAMAFQVYIIANSIKRFTVYLSLPWPNGQPPFSALNSYVVFIGIGVVMLPFFVVVAMMKIGNYSNDGHKLGNQRKCFNSSVHNIYQNIKMTAKDMRRKKRFHIFRLIWRHSVPIAPFLHMLAALCFLIPRVLMEAQLIKHGFLGKGDIWKTEIDFILNRLEDKRISMLSFLNTINDTERSQLNLESYTLNQYLTKQSNLAKQYEVHLEESGHLSMEFINFAVALFVLSVRYPSVFWRVNKGFGFLFSINLVINLFQSLFIYSAFQVAFKVLVCDPSQVLVRFHNSSNLTVFRITVLFIAYIILLTMSSTPLYMYGLQKYREWRVSQTRRLHITLLHDKQRLCGHLPHFCAFIALIILSLCVSPLFYELIVIYCGSLDCALLAGIISTAFHFLFWIILWLLLTLKNKWNFTINFDCDDFDNKFNNINRMEKKLLPYARGETPLLVIENGHTYQIRETASKRAILGVAQKSRFFQKPMSPTEDEDIYWLKPKPSTPNKVLGKESPEDENTMTWLKNDKKFNGNKNNKVSFDDGNSTNGSKGRKKNSRKSPKNTLKSKKNKSDENGIDFDELSDHSDGDYATLRRIVTNDFNGSNLTHMSLCPLRNESIEMQKTKISPIMDGDYELLVEHTFSPNPTFNVDQSPVVVYSDNVCNNMTSTPLSVAAHFGKECQNINEQLTPRSGSISETSTSPEKGSDTSSGVHSNSSNGANSTPPPTLAEKRSSSMESLLHRNLLLAEAAAAAKPCFRSLSLQRYMSSLPTEQNHNKNYVPMHGILNQMPFETTDNTMVIRRTKRPQRTSDIFNTNNTNTAKNELNFGRETNLRMTSFTENPGYMKFHSMPCQPKMVQIPSVPIPQSTLNSHVVTRQTFNDFKLYTQNQNLYSQVNTVQKPIVSIAPQVMPINGSPNFLDQSQARESANYSFISSGCDPVVSEAHTT